MQTINGIATSLGLSVRAVRLRRDMLNGILDAYIKRGDRGELLFTGDALAILQRLEAIRHGESLSVRQAAARIHDELDGDSVETLHQPESLSASPSSDVAILQGVIEDLRRDRDAWRAMATKLQDQQALPSPRRWFGLFRRYATT
jgi:hypothetical protein